MSRKLLGLVCWVAASIGLSNPLVAAQVTLRWSDNSTNEVGFTIERASGLGATEGFASIANVASAPADVAGRGQRSWVDTSVLPATAYSYRLRAYNAAGVSGYSNTADVTTKPAVPEAPGGAGADDGPDYVPPEITVEAQFTVQGDRLVASRVEVKP